MKVEVVQREYVIPCLALYNVSTRWESVVMETEKHTARPVTGLAHSMDSRAAQRKGHVLSLYCCCVVSFIRK